MKCRRLKSLTFQINNKGSIDRKGYGTSLTPMGALTVGIKQFKEHHSNGG